LANPLDWQSDGFLLRAGGWVCNDLGYEDENHFTARVRMFEHALTVANDHLIRISHVARECVLLSAPPDEGRFVL